MLVKYCQCGLTKWWGEQEFSIPHNVLGIVYGQTICWIGTFYCPLLPAICIIKYFFIFYIKKVGSLFGAISFVIKNVEIRKGCRNFSSSLFSRYR